MPARRGSPASVPTGTPAGARTAASAVLAVVLALAGCAGPSPQRAGIATDWVASPNRDARRANLVVIHYTSDDTAQRSLVTLTSRSTEVSAHYLVVRDGRIVQLVDERERAWHAGISRWGNHTDINSSSLGIELDNNGRDPFDARQIDALLRLLADIKRRHQIPTANFVGHADVAPRRKPDPGRLFPWKLLAANGFGLWCSPPYADPPAGFDALLGLQAFGYDVGNADAAIRAFKTHFAPDDPSPLLTERDRGQIACLVRASVSPP